MDPHTTAFLDAPIGIVLLENRVIRAANLRFAEMFRGPLDGFDGMDMARLYPSVEDYQRIGERGLAAMRQRGTYDDERIMQRLDGELFWCRGRGRSLTPEDPFARGVWSFSDLSEARPVVQLTPREREVAMLTGKGMTSKEIGRALNLSYRTVEQHRARLLQKFDARNIAELVARFSGMPF